VRLMGALGVSGLGVWLVAIWLLLWNDLSVANVVSGVAVAVAVLSLSRLPKSYCVGSESGDRPRVSIPHLIYFGGYVLVKLVQANLVLAWEIVTPWRDRIHTGIVAVPLRTSSDLAMTVVANVITLTPGTVTIEAKGTPPVLYVHVLHLDDIERVKAELLHLEELSVRAFGSRAARAQLGGGS
jgi:multicomponent Na+:H+ antiporter subunit E